MSAEFNEFAEAVRVELSKGSYQMPFDRLPYETRAAAIAAVLVAKGYRKPRAITTEEERDSLPYDTVLLSNTIAYQNCGHGDWSAAGRFYDASQISLPAYVLHEPKVQP